MILSLALSRIASMSAAKAKRGVLPSPQEVSHHLNSRVFRPIKSRHILLDFERFLGIVGDREIGEDCKGWE